MPVYPLRITGILLCIWTILLVLPLQAQKRSVRVVVRDPQTGKALQTYTHSYALVIGVSDYTNGWPDLPGVRRDVQAVRAALERQGFQVTVVEDPKHRQLEQAFRDFINRYGLQSANRLLFYFAGHGHTLRPTYGGEMGYIVPADAPNPNRDRNGFLSRAMDMQQLEVYARRIQSRHALFLFDACFSGSIFALSRAVPENISYKTAEPVRQFITSGSADEQVPDESIFRRQFIAALNGEGDVNDDGYVTGTELGEFLQEKVINYSRGSQHPQYGKIRDPNLDKGDFVFQLAASGGATAAALPPLPSGHGFTLEDLEREAERIEQVKAAWQANLQEMEQAFGQVSRYERRDITAKMKVAAWERFQETYKQDNPYSTRDDELRKKARERLIYWRGYRPPPTPPIQVPGPGGPMTNSIGMEFVLIPAGEFMMGSSKGYSEEQPVHRVVISKSFYMGKYEVTQAQWEAVMGNNPSGFKGANRPVESVSWNDVQEFIQRLNAREGGNNYRLPTEAEWEYACRAGSQTRYSFGDSKEDLRRYGNYADVNTDYSWSDKAHNDGYSETAPVGSYEPNGWGLYDMHGNVWEWCQDWYGSYPSGTVTDPTGPSSGSDRVRRGGSWHYVARYCRSAYRYGNSPGYRDAILGFRLVRRAE